MRTHQLEVSQDKVMNEMKSYIGADEMIELVQKARGFKTYRELYNKKIVELESSSKNLKDVVRDAKVFYY
jgi:intraflagellar transport protein 81